LPLSFQDVSYTWCLETSSPNREAIGKAAYLMSRSTLVMRSFTCITLGFFA
jgi:hypothetical protein